MTTFTPRHCLCPGDVCLEDDCPVCSQLDGEEHCPMCPCDDCVELREAAGVMDEL